LEFIHAYCLFLFFFIIGFTIHMNLVINE